MFLWEVKYRKMVYRILRNKHASAFAEVYVTSWMDSWDPQLSNGGFGLKIGQLLRELSFSRRKVIPIALKLCRCIYCAEYGMWVLNLQLLGSPFQLLSIFPVLTWRFLAALWPRLKSEKYKTNDLTCKWERHVTLKTVINLLSLLFQFYLYKNVGGCLIDTTYSYKVGFERYNFIQIRKGRLWFSHG